MPENMVSPPEEEPRPDIAKLEALRAEKAEEEAEIRERLEVVEERMEGPKEDLPEEAPIGELQPTEPVLEPSPQKVSIGRVVVYRSRTGNYSVPAIVNCTLDSIYQPGVEAGFVPALTKADNVHLTVFSPGRPGMRVTQEETPGAEAFVVQPTHGMPISENVAGCYQEWDIPYDEAGSPGTWMWPPRV
jgi:hypothetical protein